MNSELPHFEAILFDMDGLILDSEETYVGAWERAAADLGSPLEPGFAQSLFGRHADDVARALQSVLGDRYDPVIFFQSAKNHWYRLLEAQGIDPLPGVMGLISTLQGLGIPYALATNSDHPYADYCLECAGLRSFFPHFITRDQVERGKPAPDLFQEASKRLGVAARHCLVLEDSETGLRAASAFGATPILIQRRVELRDKLSPHAYLSFPDLWAFRAMLIQSGHFPQKATP